jgi:PAS domain S-box-containing protein
VLPAVRIRSCIFCLTLLFACAPCAGLAQAAPGAPPAADLSQKNVLILNALESNVPISESTSRGIRKVLDSGGVGVRNQFFDYLDLVRNPEPEHRGLMADYLRQRYGHRQIDLVITLYPEALLFALNEGCTIFPGAPLVALYLPEGFELPQGSCPVIQQIVLPDIRGTLEIALKLVPDARRVYVVSGTHSLDKWLENRARQDLKQWEPLLEFRYLSDLSMNAIMAALSKAPVHSIVLVTAFQKDVTGELFTSAGVVEKLGRTSKAPVFGLFDTVIGHGIVGGSVVSFELIGTKAAELGLDILREAQSPENIPAFLTVPHLPMFDWKQIRHWGLSEDDLPPGSIVINREPTFWDFKYHILAGLVFIVGQSFLIFFLLAQRRHRRAAEENLRWKTEELDKFFSMSLDLLCIAGTDGYFLRLNPAWEKTLGYRITELLSRRFLEFVHPDDVAATSAVIQALADQKQVVDFSNRYRCQDGSYRQMLWSAAAVGNMIYAAARDLTERVRAEETIRESAKELQSLTGRLILGQEEERRRLARELHDDLSQRLAVLAIEAGKTESAVKDGHDPILKPLRGLRDQAIRIAADVHDISRRLHPSILDDLGLAKAVGAECARFSTREGVDVAFTAPPIPERLPQDVSLALYRIVQEGLNNIAKHACARHVTVSLGESEERLRLSIKDDGIGFDAAEVKKKPGLGLSSIRERVRLVHGKHRITSEPEKGTTIEVAVPIIKAPETPAASLERLP